MNTKRKLLSFLLCFSLCACFLPAINAQAATTKAKYKMVKEKVTYEDGDKIRGIVSFEYPLLKGDSDEVYSINEQLKKIAADYFASDSAQNLKENALSAIQDNRFYDDSEQYYYETSCSVTYNKNNIISLCMTYRWYAGGVSNQGDSGYTFDVSTGKQLGITDVVAGTSKQVKNKILAAAKKYFEGEEGSSYASWSEVSPIIKKIPLKKFKFYLTPKKVNLCFESYELGTNFWTSFTVNGIYK